MEKQVGILEKYRSELFTELENILHFWMNRMVDKHEGGFYGRIDGENQLHPKADKGVVLNARILWTFSAAFKLTQRSEYLDIARLAKDYIQRFFIDHQFGGVYWMLDFTGKPVNSRKQIYAQAFALYGFVEYYSATNDDEALRVALSLYNVIEKYSFDTENGGYLEALACDWSSLEDLRLSSKDANEPKSMNTHLHVLEAYTNLYKSYKNAEIEKQLYSLIDVFEKKIINSSHRLNLFFNNHWVVRSFVTSFGHDIEASWLLFEAAEILGNTTLLDTVKTKVLSMVDENILYGLDSDYGLMNEAQDNEIIDSDKHWWPQAEAMVGYLNAFQLTGKNRYLDFSISSWEFVKANLLDTRNGEWFWSVTKDGKPSKIEDKAGPWKCPYHNGRACIEIISRINQMLD